MTEQPGRTEQPGGPEHPAGTAQDGTTAEAGPLERRYRRLLYAYPNRYRSSRGDELVGTYLDLVEPDRRWPSPRDAVDMLRGGLRQRLREQGALGLAAGLPVAATTALSMLAALAAFLLVQVEFTNMPADVLPALVGPAQTLGVFLWAGWLLAALATAVLPARWARRGVAAAVLLTLILIPAAPLAGLPRPPLYVLVPVLAFGLTALALPAHPGWAGRILPPLGALTGMAVAALFEVAEGGGNWFTSYNSTVEVLGMAGVGLVGLALALGLVRAVTGDSRALWSVVLLVTPAGLLAIRPITEWYWGGAPTWSELAATTVVLALVGAGVLLAVVAWHGARYRAVRARSAGNPCPTCGHVSEVGQQADAGRGWAAP
ncbi:GlsB/YeaQ/YmgE family stress response membrane protein [Micromonospora sp. WMMD1102]|uniref:GlsB/YeaQ/YmgE family stress response membrane protein n=1 Tax=Micromonospora sp. WMMD1102 TaxID=3016105 RepID=UPI002415202B|nr:GlsB/YeaQ/YmgE family stress response membrane protein [Micromonospora sp. WMMD1102]MDG4788943.1 GlsB/YeaQ/YmgE family stress response membrane protein [Micromonospora sp. WMMD1102]